MAPPPHGSSAAGHLFEGLTSLGDLADRIRGWRSFSDPEVYDPGGVVLLLGACLDHLAAHALPVEIEDLGERLTREQAELVLKLAETLKANPSVWRGEPTP